MLEREDGSVTSGAPGWLVSSTAVKDRMGVPGSSMKTENIMSLRALGGL